MRTTLASKSLLILGLAALTLTGCRAAGAFVVGAVVGAAVVASYDPPPRRVVVVHHEVVHRDVVVQEYPRRNELCCNDGYYYWFDVGGGMIFIFNPDRPGDRRRAWNEAEEYRSRIPSSHEPFEYRSRDCPRR